MDTWKKCGHPRRPETTCGMRATKPGGECRTCKLGRDLRYNHSPAGIERYWVYDHSPKGSRKRRLHVRTEVHRANVKRDAARKRDRDNLWAAAIRDGV